MDGMIQPLIIAACVGLLVWWVASLMSGDEGKKKLQERLTGEGSPDANTSRGPSVVLASSENAIPEFLREKPWAVKMQSVLCQAYPDSKLNTFIIILLSLVAGAFLIATWFGCGCAPVASLFASLRLIRSGGHPAN